MIRLDGFRFESEFKEFQKTIFEVGFNEKTPFLYFNNINAYLFFALSNKNDTCLLDLVLSKQFLSKNIADVIII